MCRVTHPLDAYGFCSFQKDSACCCNIHDTCVNTVLFPHCPTMHACHGLRSTLCRGRFAVPMLLSDCCAFPPGSISSCDAFLNVFQSKGLRQEVICPCASSPEALTVAIRRYWPASQGGQPRSVRSGADRSDAHRHLHGVPGVLRPICQRRRALRSCDLWSGPVSRLTSPWKSLQLCLPGLGSGLTWHGEGKCWMAWSVYSYEFAFSESLLSSPCNTTPTTL